ncbi:aminodeoxychorismate synthase, subunit I [Marinitoga hydrogenitolerans DSM 16785]|uniref:Anthranilate synthase component 1 n=1 Tax=Marinitoga hydrogenitolerans (strain DSM 16785 / JCM 12826 / AT1271) TaxID=1122195 RepID=A0A1M4YDD2_MARH1|nr:aminodeoxychorismate synthase component I [Marinitoga hydrogenitolerans]SHF03834.1 aminodeoxychorismate synthase, subunit I [Marinitoga hydrogenitolerans DSM 16785]
MIEKIETQLKLLDIFAALKNRKNTVFLDSQKDKNRLGKYSFLGLYPFLIFKVKNNKIIIEKDRKINEYYAQDPFLELKKLLDQYNVENNTHLPFIGGAMGYIGYDSNKYLEEIKINSIDDVNIYDIYMAFYDSVIIYDHMNEEMFLSSLNIEKHEKIKGLIEKAKKFNYKKKNRYLNINIKFNMTKDYYLKSIEKIKDYIYQGDVYQVNFTQRIEVDLIKKPEEVFFDLRVINPAPFASYIDTGEFQIISCSPERFIRLKNNIVETRPIKGTRPRGKNEKINEYNKKELLNSAKDKAELLMIVDLERNDLSKVCIPGTVKVPELFVLEEYATVYHLVSTVVGKLDKNNNAIDLIKATFPGGSITGAPKIRAMEIIDELEPTQRNIYTGSIGYIGFDNVMDLNIVIRTIVCKEQKAYAQFGGGIVWDSNPIEEYEESLTKGKALIEGLRMI